MEEVVLRACSHVIHLYTQYIYWYKRVSMQTVMNLNLIYFILDANVKNLVLKSSSSAAALRPESCNTLRFLSREHWACAHVSERWEKIRLQCSIWLCLKKKKKKKEPTLFEMARRRDATLKTKPSPPRQTNRKCGSVQVKHIIAEENSTWDSDQLMYSLHVGDVSFFKP